jgi:hypothetical protein
MVNITQLILSRDPHFGFRRRNGRICNVVCTVVEVSR